MKLGFKTMTSTMKIAAAGCLALILAGCAPSAPTTPQATSPAARPTSQPMNAHWVQDQRLRLVMAELAKRNPNWPKSIPQEPESPAKGKPEDFAEVAALSESLMQAADRLPDVAGGIKMGEADRRGFLAEAQVLHDQAERLRDAARQQLIEQMQIQMTSINSTCISCHSRYRDFSGQLNGPRAMRQENGAPASGRV